MKLPDLSFLHEVFRAKSEVLSKKILVDGGHDLILFEMHWTKTSQTLKNRYLRSVLVQFLSTVLAILAVERRISSQRRQNLNACADAFSSLSPARRSVDCKVFFFNEII